MELMTEAQRGTLLDNGARRGEDHWPVVKLFNPCGAGTWLLTEIDPERPEVAFGLCDLGQGAPELGSVSLAELGRVRNPLGLGLERDLYFTAQAPISVYAATARRHGHIVDGGDGIAGAVKAQPAGEDAYMAAIRRSGGAAAVQDAREELASLGVEG